MGEWSDHCDMRDFAGRVSALEAKPDFAAAMERLRLHYDKDSKTPYTSWRGPTPKDQPSIPKDIRIVFGQLQADGIWPYPAPVLDPLWDPS